MCEQCHFLQQAWERALIRRAAQTGESLIADLWLLAGDTPAAPEGDLPTGNLPD